MAEFGELFKAAERSGGIMFGKPSWFRIYWWLHDQSKPFSVKDVVEATGCTERVVRKRLAVMIQFGYIEQVGDRPQTWRRLTGPFWGMVASMAEIGHD